MKAAMNGLAPLLAVALTLTAAAQPVDTKQSAPPPAAAKSAGDPDPPAEMKSLTNAFSGEWAITETHPAVEGGSQGAATGKEVWHALAGGVPLIEEYELNAAGGTLRDTAAIWWDGKAQALKGLFCGTFNDNGCSSISVKWRDGVAVMEGDVEEKGNAYHWFEQFSFSSPDVFTQTLYIGEKGKPPELVATIEARRIKRSKSGG
ncbi:MAG TPA: hypothetical protein VGR67_07605 [Candidatus Polarisedimenticolia bacterium]|jgi:hypothetical protein|nr:hypothetical protein [Candidatus Polarisedimenticolia bacterium]